MPQKENVSVRKHWPFIGEDRWSIIATILMIAGWYAFTACTGLDV